MKYHDPVDTVLCYHIRNIIKEKEWSAKKKQNKQNKFPSWLFLNAGDVC